MRLGILGGTFDPIHLGHLRSAEEIREELGLEKIFLIPGAVPPHKDTSPITPFPERLAMTQRAVEGLSGYEVLDIEGLRKDKSYTIETLKDLHNRFSTGAEWFFIIGMDAFLEIKTWKEYTRLFTFAHFVVISRPGYANTALESFVDSLNVGFQKGYGNHKNTFIAPCGNQLLFYETTGMEISSTRIRSLVSQGRSIRFLVPETVRLYIQEKGLYLKNGNA
ncbi:MAG: nicotinate (nicotinamide) nucleotide adenylyltransferase [Deltaproteobacteria bacterium]|nr:nicotinate (nicotinamide) nucleotide adenylyltransferase [Deltaproteobacteria bacterium]